jgi:predicted transposase YbfD/YdcC
MGAMADRRIPIGFIAFFEDLADPRVERTRVHSLMNILIIALLAVVCGAEGWDDMEDFGEAKHEWLCTFLDLSHGIPSADTFRRVFSALDPEAFGKCFIAWVQALAEGTDGKIIPIDGKTVRHSFDKATGHKALHLVNAWVLENRLVLGQYATEEKSNEITAIPKLLEMLDIRGATVTLDAMGCQKAIAAAIVEKEADYVMGLKGNQGTAHQEVSEFFTDARASGFKDVPHTSHRTVDGSEHGRTEIRRIFATEKTDWFEDKGNWPGLKSFILIESQRTVDQKTTTECRYYWSSRVEPAEVFARIIRGHWSIENELHWCLDVGLREDDSRVRTDHGPENLALLRKIAINLEKNEKTSKKTSKRGVRAKQKRAGWDNEYLVRLLRVGIPTPG